MTISNDLQALEQLHESGSLSDDEFALAKAKLLNEQRDVQPPGV